MSHSGKQVLVHVLIQLTFLPNNTIYNGHVKFACVVNSHLQPINVHNKFGGSPGTNKKVLNTNFTYYSTVTSCSCRIVMEVRMRKTLDKFN